jgi:hypothetical protein
VGLFTKPQGPPPLCGARNRQGFRCKLPGSGRGGRCRFHGGASTGAPGNLNALKHGFYSARALPGEACVWAAASGESDLRDEIRLLRVMVVRVMSEMARTSGRGESGLELVEVERSSEPGTRGTVRRVKRRPDLLGYLNRLVRSLAYCSAVERHAQVAGIGTGDSPEEIAAKVREFLAATENIFVKPGQEGFDEIAIGRGANGDDKEPT